MAFFTFSRPLAVAFFFLLCAGTPPSAPRPEAPATALSSQIDQIVEGGDLADAFWGLYVRRVDSGEVLYRLNARRRFLPASNQKVFTTATALDALGPDYRYETTLFLNGEVDGSVLRGDLILEGSGDPTFGSSEMGGGDPLRRWARALAAMGVTRVEGRLIGDDNVFDNRPYAEGWDVDYVTSQSSRLLGVSAGGLSYSDNLVRVQIRAGRPGQPPAVQTLPAGTYRIRNEATTSARRRGRAIDLKRSFGEDALTLTGSVSSGYVGTVFMPVTNPTTFALRSLKQDLQNAGLDVSQLQLFDIDDLGDEAPVEEGQPLFVHYSPLLSQIIALTNKESNNFYADQLFRSYGYGGTANGSETRIKALLERAGVDPETISIRDGSGLSRKDLITPQAMGDLLAYMYRHEAAEAFLRSLPRGGEPESTLRYRMAGVPVRAKTGSVEFARALSGYVTMQSGQEVAFAFFANNYDGPSYRVTQAFDRIVRAIAASSAG